MAATTNTSVAYYAQFFPTRNGSPATALALAVTNPGAESSSSGKTIEQVAADARARLDAKYAELQASGQPFDYNSFEGRDWYTLTGDLDRRSLYAVSANVGGKFTQQEQGIAQSILSQQQGLASGQYDGPISQKGKFVDPFAGDIAAQLKADAQFLDKVSPDEQTSIAWAVNRASAQRGYELAIAGEGKTPENIDTENPLVKLIEQALSTINEIGRGTTHGRIQTADDLKSQPWFAGFEGQLDALLSATKGSS